MSAVIDAMDSFNECSRTGMQAVVLAWILSPAMELDQSESGRARGRAVNVLIERALHEVGSTRMDQLRLDISNTPELSAVDEPEPPASYRMDVLTILDCACRAELNKNRSALREAEGTLEDSLYFLQQAAKSTVIDLAAVILKDVREWVSTHPAVTSEGWTDFLEPSRRSVRDLVQRIA